MKCLVTGAGGFIGVHLTRKLENQGHEVRGVDIRRPRWSPTPTPPDFRILDLRFQSAADQACEGIDWVFHLAADMGGMGYITTHEASIIANNTRLDLNMVTAAAKAKVDRFFYSSSVCVYPTNLLDHTQVLPLREHRVYPANPQLTYGWTKLHGEHLCQAYQKAGLLETRIARFQNTFGPETDFEGPTAKAPAQLCRKVAEAKRDDLSRISIWGDGRQTRSFMWVGDCVNGIVGIMKSDYPEPFNLGPDRVISINQLVDLIMETAGVNLTKTSVVGPQGVRGRAFDHSRVRGLIGWKVQTPLEDGIAQTYRWVESQQGKTL